MCTRARSTLNTGFGHSHLTHAASLTTTRGRRRRSEVGRLQCPGSRGHEFENPQQQHSADQRAQKRVLDGWVDVDLMRREQDAAQCPADVGADYAECSGGNPTHGLPARDNGPRDETNDKPENDQPDNMQDHDESPLNAVPGEVIHQG